MRVTLALVLFCATSLQATDLALTGGTVYPTSETFTGADHVPARPRRDTSFN